MFRDKCKRLPVIFAYFSSEYLVAILSLHTAKAALINNNKHGRFVLHLAWMGL